MRVPFLAVLPCFFLAALLAGCGERERGPLQVSAIGGDPDIVNPNLEPLDPASAFLIEAVAQGLVRFDAAGEIEPALAQSWIVSDDGLRYTFRIRRAEWVGGGRVTAEQVVERLRAAVSRASRNPLLPVLGIAEAVAMTDEVLEISLDAPQPNFLQLLAQPQMAIVRAGQGTGPYRIAERRDGAVQLALRQIEEEEAEEAPESDIVLRGEPAALAVARFGLGGADVVIGGTVGSLPIVRAAAPPAAALAFDPAAGLFGLSFASDRGLLGEAAFRNALSMAIDRPALIAAIGARGLEPRTSLLPAGLEEVPAPAAPEWGGMQMAQRRALAARAVRELGEGEPPRLRVAMPEGIGYRLVFIRLRRDWRLIGVDAERVAPDAEADLRLVDSVAPAAVALWYLHHFTCRAGPVCDPEADMAIEAAAAARGAEREALLARADAALTPLVPFVPIASPVRWSLAAPRVTGFRPNIFARHPAGELIAERP